jgi:GNAT superfamily N-acetyltransferase
MIYKASREDLRELTEMAKRFEECTSHVTVEIEYAIKKYESLFDLGIGHVFGMRIDGKVVGGLGCVQTDSFHSPAKMLIETFWFVLPEYRGRGKELLEAFESLSRELKCDQVVMVHLSDSMPEILERLYTKMGYKLVEKCYVKEV